MQSDETPKGQNIHSYPMCIKPEMQTITHSCWHMGITHICDIMYTETETITNTLYHYLI